MLWVQCFKGWNENEIWLGMKGLKKNIMMPFHAILKEKFQRYFGQWKTWWNKFVECRKTFWYNLLSFSVHFCLGK